MTLRTAAIQPQGFASSFNDDHRLSNQKSGFHPISLWRFRALSCVGMKGGFGSTIGTTSAVSAVIKLISENIVFCGEFFILYVLFSHSLPRFSHKL
jgi:hypothetical protein